MPPEYNKKEELFELVKNLKEEDIIKACNYIKTEGLPQHRKATTTFILFNNEKFPLKYTLEVANNIIKNNTIQLGPKKEIAPRTWTSLGVLRKLFPNPTNFKIVAPEHTKEQKILEDYREDLLNYAIELGLTLDENPKEYIALKLTNNIAEIHNVKNARFKMIVKYDDLSEQLKKDVKKLPETYKWTLDGEIYIKNEQSLEKAKKILEYLINVQDDAKSVNSKQSVQYPTPSGLVKDLYWYQVIGLIMYIIGTDKTYRVKELEIHPLIREYIKHKNTNSIYSAIIGQLQIHTSKDSKTVYYTKKTPPAIFDKNENAEWFLTEEGIKYIENNLSDYIEKLKNAGLLHLKLYADDEQNVYVKKIDEYTKDDFLKEVYITENDYNTLINMLNIKRNIILQGAPGVGKTFSAKRLAYSILGVEDDSRVKIVQFHQSYGYEDFILGYRPTESGFKLKYGPFYNFCKEAEKYPEDEKFFFIIDEINRGKLSKIFGELLMLMEPDKRGDKIELLYETEPFSVPKNVYIIGMMNTADRSIAMIDYALRRRFAFYDFKPAFENTRFKEYQNNLNNEKFNSLINKIIELNTMISKDNCLGPGFQIGHSYFIDNNKDFKVTDEWLNCKVEYEVLPLLKEYWFDEIDKIEKWSDILRTAIK